MNIHPATLNICKAEGEGERRLRSAPKVTNQVNYFLPLEFVRSWNYFQLPGKLDGYTPRLGINMVQVGGKKSAPFKEGNFISKGNDIQVKCSQPDLLAKMSFETKYNEIILKRYIATLENIVKKRREKR